MINRIFSTAFCTCLFISLNGQTVQQVISVLEGKVYAQSWQVNGRTESEPIHMEFLKENNGVILETPGMISIEFALRENFWQVMENDGKVVLQLKGRETRTFVIAEVTESRITGIPHMNPSMVPDSIKVRMVLDVVYQPKDQPKEKLVGNWSAVYDEGEGNQIKFSEIQIEENGAYQMSGDSLSSSGTWQLSPSGRYFTVSEPEKDDIIFRIENLTEENLTLLQGHFSSALLLNFERKSE